MIRYFMGLGKTGKDNFPLLIFQREEGGHLKFEVSGLSKWSSEMDS